MPEALAGVPSAGTGPVTVHASAVAHAGRAALILGRSGAGKSALALELIAFGARLVADDRTVLGVSDGVLRARPPASIAGRIEARFVGLLRLPHEAGVPVALAVDLDREETERLPRSRMLTLMGHRVPLLRRVKHTHFAPSLFAILAHGLPDP